MKLLKLIVAAAIAFSASMAFACNVDYNQSSILANTNPTATGAPAAAASVPYGSTETNR